MTNKRKITCKIYSKKKEMCRNKKEKTNNTKENNRVYS